MVRSLIVGLMVECSVKKLWRGICRGSWARQIPSRPSVRSQILDKKNSEITSSEKESQKNGNGKCYQVVIYQASIIYLCGKKAYECFLAFARPLSDSDNISDGKIVGVDEDAFAAPLLAPQKCWLSCGRFQRERMKQTGVLLWSLGELEPAV